MARIALLQSRPGIEPAENGALGAAIGEAAAVGARCSSRPRCRVFSTGTGTRRRKLRTEDDDAVLAACRRPLRRHGLWLILARWPCAWIAQARHRGFLIDTEAKSGPATTRFTCSTSTADGESWRESAVYNAGESAALIGGTPAAGSA